MLPVGKEKGIANVEENGFRLHVYLCSHITAERARAVVESLCQKLKGPDSRGPKSLSCAPSYPAGKVLRTAACAVGCTLAPLRSCDLPNHYNVRVSFSIPSPTAASG